MIACLFLDISYSERGILSPASKSPTVISLISRSWSPLDLNRPWPFTPFTSSGARSITVGKTSSGPSLRRYNRVQGSCTFLSRSPKFSPSRYLNCRRPLSQISSPVYFRRSQSTSTVDTVHRAEIKRLLTQLFYLVTYISTYVYINHRRHIFLSNRPRR
jgi:hypothetical protein